MEGPQKKVFFQKLLLFKLQLAASQLLMDFRIFFLLLISKTSSQLSSWVLMNSFALSSVSERILKSVWHTQISLLLLPEIVSSIISQTKLCGGKNQKLLLFLSWDAFWQAHLSCLSWFCIVFSFRMSEYSVTLSGNVQLCKNITAIEEARIWGFARTPLYG